MTRGLKLTLFVVALGACFAALGLPGCGGGGGGGGTGDATPKSGTVAIVLADGAADQFDKIIVRVTEVSLLPQDEAAQPVVIYADATGFEINILELRDEDFILTVNRDVPPGMYEKIRLEVAEVRGEGGPCDELRLPSGKIDLNPRGAFEVKAGGSISVRLDIDAEKSIHIANNKHCNFRPVVFVDIKTTEAVWHCPRVLAGTIAELVQDDAQAPTEAPEGFMLELGDSRGTLEVRLGDGTAVFDGAGDAADWRALVVGQKAKVRGTLDAKGRLAASLVVMGDVMVVKGEALGVVDPQGLFGFRPAAGQEVTGDFNVLVQDDTLVLANCDQPISPALIKAGVRCRLIGKLDLGSDEFKAALVFVEPAELAGTITALAAATELVGDKVTVQASDGVETTVLLPADASVRLEGDGAVPRDLLCVGTRVRVAFDLEAANSLTAAAMYVQPDTKTGLVSAIEAEGRVLVLDTGARLHVRDGATIVDQRGDADELADFGAFAVGVEVRAFTLTPCAGGDHEAFVVLITEASLPL